MKSEKTLVSIIIPHKNTIHKLERLLLSIPEHNHIQVIVVDDGSDNRNRTELIQDSFPRIEFITNNRGIHNAGAARNTGLSHAKGEWLLFADADDYFVDNAFSCLLKHIDNKYDCIYFKPTSFNENTGKLDDRHLPYEKLINSYLTDSRNEKYLRYKFYVPWSKLIKASLINKYTILFDEIPASNDVMFSLFVGYHANRITAYNKTIYCVTRANNSLTTTKNIINTRSRLDAAIRYNNFILDNGIGIEYAMKARRFYKKSRYKPWKLKELSSIIEYKRHILKILKYKLISQ